MKSEVDFTDGLSVSRVDIGTPDFDEITPKVSPACTVQKRAPLGFGFDFLVVVNAVVVAMCLRGIVGTGMVACDAFPPASSPERIRMTAIVAASKNAAGAT
jgi:hypothetical protein